jgi:hypothetical protein
MRETELDRERHRAQVAEGLAAALTEAARRVSSYLQSELQRPDWEQRTGKEGLEAAPQIGRHAAAGRGSGPGHGMPDLPVASQQVRSFQLRRQEIGEHTERLARRGAAYDIHGGAAAGIRRRRRVD